MAANEANNVEDTEMTECDGEKVVTMMDVLQEQQEFEEDAKAVLGASDDMNCTYSKGYIKRQAIYACLTCCSDARQDETKRAGVCLACSLHCHENHELIELYTKRNFRCDCGNPKFNSHTCTFTPNKTEINLENNYNQNFSGIYCICNRPYPDPEATEEDEMIQCIICEDWLHANHLDAVVPGNDQYSEMVCKACMEANEFLHDYSNLAVNIEMGDIDIVSVNGSDSLSNGTANNTLSNGVSEDSIINDTNEMETDTNLKQKDNNLENSEQEDKDQPTIASNPQNDTGNIVTENVDKVLENDIEKENDPAAEPKAKPEEDNHASNNEEAETVTTESNTETETKTDTIENVEKVENKDVDEGDTNKNSETLQSEDKDTENESELENGAPKANKDSTEADKIGTSNESEDADDVETQLSNMHREPEVQNVETKPDAETPMDTTETEGDIDEINETSVVAAVDSLEKPIEDKLSNSEEAQPESIKDENESPADNTKPDSIETNKSDEITTTDNMCPNDDQNSTKNDNTLTNDLELSDNLTKLEEPATGVPNTTEKRHLNDDSDDTPTKKPKLDNQCLKPRFVKRIHKGATFWPSTFRQKLCTCCECITMYKDLSVLFLIDPEDTVSAYETLGKEKSEGEPSTQYEKGLKALSSLDRIQQINALTEYNKMRDKLLDFLKSFRDKKEVVKEEDIKAFFAGMKPKRESDGVYFCR